MSDGAGWFADPSGKLDTFRWWDGRAWTRWLSADPRVPAPSSSENRSQTTAPGGKNPQHVTSFRETRPADRVVRLPAAAVIVVAAVVLALVAAGAIITLTADRPLTGPAVAPPPRVEPPLAVTYDAETRTASVQELRLTLPTAPFTCEPKPQKATELFSSALTCGAPVHPDYNAEKSDWGSATGLGLLTPERQAEPDLRKMLASTASGIIVRNYDPETISIKKAKNRPYADVAPEGRARIVTAEIHVDHEGLPTAYDSITVAVFRLASGQHVAWWGLIPTDSPKALKAAYEASARTLTARK